MGWVTLAIIQDSREMGWDFTGRWLFQPGVVIRGAWAVGIGGEHKTARVCDV
jgi:hypothetical protein